MGAKKPMQLQALYDLSHRVVAGSRLKIEFVQTFDENPRLAQAETLARFLRECAPESATAVIERDRRPELEAAAEAHFFKSSRTFFIKFLKDRERYDILHKLIASGLISRMQKA